MVRIKNIFVSGIMYQVSGSIVSLRAKRSNLIITVCFILFMCFSVTGCYSQKQGVARHSDPEREAKGKNLDNEKITRPAVGGTQNDKKNKEEKDPLLWDFGKVKEGEVLEHGFIFKNESKVVINIKDINTSCGCTISEVKKKRLLPGETTIIGVKFNSKGYSGAVTQYVYMNTDVIDNSIIRYIIKAEVGK